MPGLMTMMALAWASSPSSVKLCFSSGGGDKKATSANPLLKKRSSSSAHLLVGRGRALAATATATAFCDEQHQQTVELMRRLGEDGWVEEHMLSLLTPVAEAWQPADLLPTFAATAEEQRSQVAELQARAAGVPDDLLVCLVGNMVTEEGLPTYMTMANRVADINDATGCDDHGWARWLRGWTAEENRHGDLLNRYLYLCGRVDMRQVERTVHHLLRNGMRTPEPSCPYHGFIYGAFQERATFVSHARTARRAALHGDACLAKLCGVVAADEKRHEAAYTRAVARCFEADPDRVVRALAAVMRAKVTMPGELMTDGRDENLFDHFSAVAQRAGVYTAADYGDMVEHFVRRWGVAELGGLSGEGRRAQDYVCGLPRKIRRMEELAQDRAAQMEAQSVSFSWVFDRPVRLR
ncbi:Acyl-[acyl-carrier-protein] desaturase 4, chloroplastic [Dichanthelium oligosanthes]|uniref:Acyl-[acyl-carrier-protein] desaturase 4, chloroplastic n=1 Tax=Dichanthelium oligosanthes TaxID=888268 RepID=A0A1E5UI59_9POAL|nr:Acyl-[acyl-carrier-protein] desaturase 4, chloroplastic [Dichanthelium oligosanthes]